MNKARIAVALATCLAAASWTAGCGSSSSSKPKQSEIDAAIRSFNEQLSKSDFMAPALGRCVAREVRRILESGGVKYTEAGGRVAGRKAARTCLSKGEGVAEMRDKLVRDIAASAPTRESPADYRDCMARQIRLLSAADFSRAFASKASATTLLAGPLSICGTTTSIAGAMRESLVDSTRSQLREQGAPAAFIECVLRKVRKLPYADVRTFLRASFEPKSKAARDRITTRAYEQCRLN